MKKSKFLKKSLATLLALMLVVAMIPVGAAAEEAPELAKFYVNNVEATVSGSEITATSDTTTVSLSAAPTSGSATLSYQDKNGNWDESVGSIDLNEKAAVSNNIYSLKVKLSRTAAGSDAVLSKEYNLKITVTEAPEKNGDTTIKAVYGVAGMTNWDITGNEITISIPFGAAYPTVTADNFVTTSDKAKAEITTSFADGKGKVTVTAEDLSTDVYNVTVKNEAGFTAFTVPNQVEDTVITAEGDAQEKNTVAITVPYSTDFSEKIVPTFTTESQITKVTTDEAGKNAVVSGTTGVSFKDGVATSLVLWKGDTKAGTVAVTLTKVAKNPEVKVTEIKVDTSNSVVVSGSSVTVEMPKGYDFAAATAKTVVVKASAGATVAIPAQAGVTFNEDAAGTFTANNVNLTGKSLMIRVVSEDGKTQADYTVILSAAASAKAEMTDFTLKGAVYGGKEIAYTAKWSGNTGTVTLPYAAKNTTTLGAFKAYATLSTGATATVGSTTVTFEGATVSNLNTSAPADGVPVTYTITASDGIEKATYKVQLAFEAPKTERKIESTEFVGTNKLNDITADNTYTATLGTAKLNGETVNTIKVTLPYSLKDSAEINAYVKSLNLSEGAAAYYSGQKKLVVMDPSAAGTVAQSATPFEMKNFTDAVDTNGNLTAGKAIPLYVLSEKNAVILGNSGVVADKLFESATEYYVYGVFAAAEEGKEITSIASTLDTNVKATLSGKTITVTAPYTYEFNNTTLGIVDFSLNFELSKMATLLTDKTENAKTLVSDKGVSTTTGYSKFYVHEGQLWLNMNGTGDNIRLTENGTGTIYVRSESGKYTAYTLKVKMDAVQTGATITSLKVGNTSATINGKTINLTLPYGTKLSPVKMDIVASKMAKIEIGSAAYTANTNYNLNSDVTIKVTSEDGNTVNLYTLKATVAPQFTDVKKGTWYYDYVLQAAAAGIVNGKGNGIFDPEGNVTRRDFALMTARMLQADTSSYTTSPFKDVNDNDYALAAIAYCYDKKIIGGYEDGTFRPDAKISREEAAKIICVALGLEEVKNPTETFKDDAKIQNWAKGYVYACKEAGIFGGDNGNFLPGNPITRAETAKVMVISMDK